MDFVAYCRVSTKKEDQLNSLEAQKEFFERFAEKNNYNLIKIYSDEGLSGTKMSNRDGLNQLLEDTKEGSFNMIAIKDISRLARNTVDFLDTLRTIKQRKKKILFVNYNMDTEDVSEFHLTILAAVAQEESANISKRVKWGKRVNAEKGKVPNFVYGYNKIPEQIFTLEKNPKEVEIVKEIFSLYVEKKFGANKIAQTLNSRGVRTKRGKKWSQNAICRILTNEIYIGQVINGKEEVEDFLTGDRVARDKSKWLVHYNPDLRIIDDVMFNAAQTLLEDRYDEYKITSERTSNKYLYSKIIKCKHCGYSFRRFERTYKNTYVRWVCSGRNANGMDSCPNKSVVDEEELTASLNSIFIEILASKNEYIQAIKKEFKVLYDKENTSFMSEKDLKAELSKLESDKNKEMILYREGLQTIEEVKQNTLPIIEKIESVKDKLEMLQSKMKMEDKVDEILNKTFKDLEAMVDVDKMDNVMLKRVIEKIEVDEDKNVVVIFKVFGKLGTKGTVHLSDNSPQRCNRKTAKDKPYICKGSQVNT